MRALSIQKMMVIRSKGMLKLNPDSEPDPSSPPPPSALSPPYTIVILPSTVISMGLFFST